MKSKQRYILRKSKLKLSSFVKSKQTFFPNRCEHFRSMFQAHWDEDEKRLKAVFIFPKCG